MHQPHDHPRLPIIAGAVCTLVFLIYALNFLCFFVDDEGIPFVYAQNLLRGHGLIYSRIEGPIEGYTDFLHVLIGALALALVHARHWPKLSVFFVGKALSLAAGAGSIALVFAILRRRASISTPGAVAGLPLAST